MPEILRSINAAVRYLNLMRPYFTMQVRFYGVYIVI